MHHLRGIRPALFLAPLLLAACAGVPEPPEAGVAPPPVAASTIYVGLNCEPRDRSPAVRWIGNETDYTALHQQLDAHAMESVDAFPEMDFERRGVVLVELGRRPTTGYGLNLHTPRVAIDADGIATLEVEVREPEAGTVTAPMLTHPCLVAWLPHATFHKVRVVDTNGETLGVAEPAGD